MKPLGMCWRNPDGRILNERRCASSLPAVLSSSPLFSLRFVSFRFVSLRCIALRRAALRFCRSQASLELPGRNSSQSRPIEPAHLRLLAGLLDLAPLAEPRNSTTADASIPQVSLRFVCPRNDGLLCSQADDVSSQPASQPSNHLRPLPNSGSSCQQASEQACSAS